MPAGISNITVSAVSRSNYLSNNTPPVSSKEEEEDWTDFFFGCDKRASFQKVCSLERAEKSINVKHDSNFQHSFPHVYGVRNMCSNGSKVGTRGSVPPPPTPLFWVKKKKRKNRRRKKRRQGKRQKTAPPPPPPQLGSRSGSATDSIGFVR